MISYMPHHNRSSPDKVISKMAIQSDLVIDIGLHKGEDTAFYLAKGFRVASVEADPDLARECQARFVRELSAQRLRIIEGAIAERGPKVSFYKDDNSVWGTVHQDWAKRNEKLGSHNRLIEVGVLDISRTSGFLTTSSSTLRAANT